MNIGFDWSIFRKVNLTVEYYNKITTDLLFQVPSSIVTGFDSNWANLGKLKNDGIEVEISSQNIKTGDFSWNTSFNATFQNSTIKELPDGKISNMEMVTCIFTVKANRCIHSIFLSGKV